MRRSASPIVVCLTVVVACSESTVPTQPHVSPKKLREPVILNESAYPTLLGSAVKRWPAPVGAGRELQHVGGGRRLVYRVALQLLWFNH